MNTLKRATIIISSSFLIFFLADFAAAQDDQQVFTSVEQMPKLHGDLDSLQSEMTYPVEAWEAGIEGRVIIQFVVSKEGKAENLNVIRGQGNGIDEEAKRLIREAQFTPGKQRGEPVNVRMSMPITFDKSEYEPPKDQTDQDRPLPEPEEEKEQEEDFFVAVEDMPELKGGLGALQKKVEYPDMAKKAGIEGRVLIQLIVNEQGQVENPKVIRGIGGGCDEEALRIVKEAEFEPGRQRGEPVRVQYSLPITFQLPGDEDE